MRTIFIASTERVGEIEGMFDTDGTLLDLWCCNDASWRNEYFQPFMNRLGFTVKEAPDWMIDKLEKEASQVWGIEIYEGDY